MKTKKTRNPVTGEIVDAQVVGIASVDNPNTRVTLEDGTEILLTTVVADAVRIPEAWDTEGNPYYAVRNSSVMMILECPDEFKRIAKQRSHN